MTTTALFEQRTSPVVLSRNELASLLRAEGFRVSVEPEAAGLLSSLRVYQHDDDNFGCHLTVDSSGSLGWRGGSPTTLEFEKVIVSWYFDQVAGREDVWLYSDSGALMLRLSPDTYVEDLERIHSGWREQRDWPPGLDLG